MFKVFAVIILSLSVSSAIAYDQHQKDIETCLRSLSQANILSRKATPIISSSEKKLIISNDKNIMVYGTLLLLQMFCKLRLVCIKLTWNCILE